MNKNYTFGLLFILFLISTLQLSAQQETIHEIGFRMGGFNSFGFIYKKQLAEDRFIRYRLGSVNVDYDHSTLENELEDFKHKRFSSAVQFGLGFEKRNSITDDLRFIHGWEPRAYANYYYKSGEPGENNETIWGVGLGVGYILGLQLPLTKHIQISIETIPSVMYSFNYIENSNGIKRNSHDADFNFGINAISLSLLYRFSISKNNNTD
jgi:hypothetical protein